MEAFHDDDDFGELYATDVEAHAPPFPGFTRLYIDPEPEEEEEEADANNANKLNEPESKKNDDSVCAESTRSGSEGGGKEGNGDDCVGSDSDDDLNIVLNDEDCAGFPVGVDEEGEVGDGDEGEGSFGVFADGGNLGKNGKCSGGDRLGDGSELVSKNNGMVKGGYGSRFFHHKYMRTRGSMFVNNMKANMSMGISSLNKGRWNGDACIQNLGSSSCHVTHMCAAAVNPMVVRYGYGLFLPWYWNIFDVSIDTLKEKPWRVPGVDITDYFNFGFNENTWKLYCASLEHLWRTSVQIGIPVDESVKLNQEAMREQIDQVVSGSVLSPSSECELPKGRAIQVEDSLVERQPSIDVRRPRSRDSDVIIQIKVHESSDDCSGSGNSIVMDASLEGESIVRNNRNILNSSSERDDLQSEDQLEDVKKSEDSSVQERHGLIPRVEEDKHQDRADEHSEDTKEEPGGEMKAEEGVGIDTCSTDPCWIESELSLGDQELSLTSYTDSDSEATENSVHVDNEKTRSPLRRQSVKSVTDLKDSLPLYFKNSNNNSFNIKPVNVAYYSRGRGPFRKERRRQSVRGEPGSNLNKHVENDNDDSPILKSSGREPPLGHQFVDYDRRKERLQDFGSHKRRDISYIRETKQSCYYGGERVVDDLFQTVYTKYSQREDEESFREITNRYDRKHGYERDEFFERGYFFEPRSPMADGEDRERDWYHADWGHTADDLSPRPCRGSRQFLPKHPSFPVKERDTQRRRINDKSHFRDRNCNNDQWFDEYEFEFLNRSYRMSTFSAEREMESLDEHEKQFPHIDRDWKRSARRGGHRDRSPIVLDNLRSGKMEDKCQEYTHHQTSNLRYCRPSYTDSVRNYVYGMRVNEKFGGCGGRKHIRNNRGNDWSYGYTDAAEDEDFVIYPTQEYQLYRSPSEGLNWTEDEIVWSHHEMHATSLHAKVQFDDIKLQQHQLSMPRRGSESCLKGSSKIMCRGKRGQAVLRYRKSVDLDNGEGKSHARSSRVLSNGRLENVDQGIAKKRRALVGFDESLKKAIKFGTSKYECNHENKKWLQNLPENGQKEISDIEEGQIVTEEPYIETSGSRDVSEGAALTDSVKKRMSQNEDNSDQFIGGYDSQRILDSLAKMEKRRERFKQPITMKKEAEESLKLCNDSILDTGEMKQQRPARKRRWVGS